MFTGIIQTIGSVESIKETSGDKQITIAGDLMQLGKVELGTSIAVNGVCLTVIDFNKNYFQADVSIETLSKSNLKQLSTGAAVNLEIAMTLSTALSGHLVMGHVDGVGTVNHIINEARSKQLLIETPNELTKYVAQKGSICIDGVSLTVNSIQDNIVSINIVPHTFHATIFQYYTAGTQVNIEVDIVARYLERLLLAENNSTNAIASSITQSLLATHGFIK